MNIVICMDYGKLRYKILYIAINFKALYNNNWKSDTH